MGSLCKNDAVRVLITMTLLPKNLFDINLYLAVSYIFISKARDPSSFVIPFKLWVLTNNCQVHERDYYLFERYFYNPFPDFRVMHFLTVQNCNQLFKQLTRLTIILLRVIRRPSVLGDNGTTFTRLKYG